MSLLLLSRALGYTHRSLTRRLMPVVRPALYSGLPSSFDYRLGDHLLPHRFRPSDVEDVKDYEEKLIAGLHAHVRPGFKVVIVGGGAGITTTIAAKLVGDEGRVTCYEASRTQLNSIRECCRRNKIAHRVDLHFATVGSAVHVYGHGSRIGPVLDARKLPECDVLELDCEGAERIVLADMTIRPGVVLVETHGEYGSPTRVIRDQLLRLGYAVSDMGVAESRFAEVCSKRDFHVLIARLES
jgi:hypothetical protein